MVSRLTRAILLCALGVTALTGCPEPQAPPAPVISSIQPDSGLAGTEVVITGSNFGVANGQTQVTLGGQFVTDATTLVPGESLKFRVPAIVSSAYEVKVVLGGRASNSSSFKLLPGGSNQ